MASRGLRLSYQAFDFLISAAIGGTRRCPTGLRIRRRSSLGCCLRFQACFPSYCKVMRHRLRRTAFMLRRLPLVLQRGITEWSIIFTSKRADVLGFDVRLFRVGEDAADILSRLQSSLELIREHDPRRFRRMRRDLARIVVKPTAGAHYWILSNSCVLESPEILTRSASILALTIVHEATHGRLTQAGIYLPNALEHRLEDRCLIEERSFTLLLQQAGFTGTNQVLEWLASSMTARR
jgi:hypothetical protein